MVPVVMVVVALTEDRVRIRLPPALFRNAIGRIKD
jgi:hypothetical protein